MSAVLPGAATRPRGALAFAWRAWSTLHWIHWAIALLLGLAFALQSLPWVLQLAEKPGFRPPMLAVGLGLPFVYSVCILLGYALADAGSDTWRSRPARIVLALLASTAVGALLGGLVIDWTGFDTFRAQLSTRDGMATTPLPLLMLGDAMNVLIIGGLVVSVVELVRRRRIHHERLAGLQQQQAGIERAVLQSRLAAMQAQVEPHFLFDALVDIEHLYRRDAGRAAAVLDRLIDYLRAALPRLRDSGSTLGAEVELVQTYLAVVNALHDGRPAFTCTLDPACSEARFYPMLLLPLVQRAVRDDGAAPPALALQAHCVGGTIELVLTIDAPGLCTETPEISSVRTRLAGLYDARATLRCNDAGGATRYVLTVPADPPHR